VLLAALRATVSDQAGEFVACDGLTPCLGNLVSQGPDDRRDHCRGLTASGGRGQLAHDPNLLELAAAWRSEGRRVALATVWSSIHIALLGTLCVAHAADDVAPVTQAGATSDTQELNVAGVVSLLQMGHGLFLQVAQPEKLAAQLHLGAVSTCPCVRLHRGAPYYRAQRSEGVCVRLLFCIAEAITTEEPGAEKLHAGVCTGGAG
jgi:hypothetical protein